MTKGRHLDEDGCVKVLSKKMDVEIDMRKKSLKINRSGDKRPVAKDIGNKSWGRIDFLQKQGWSINYE